MYGGGGGGLIYILHRDQPLQYQCKFEYYFFWELLIVAPVKLSYLCNIICVNQKEWVSFH